MAAQYDIIIDQGSTFDLWFQYLTENNVGINLSGYNAELEIKKYKASETPEVFVNTYGLTYGCTAGITTGITGYGQMFLNTNYDNTNIDGGVKVIIGPAVTASLTNGNRYFYEIKIFKGQGITYAQKLVEGRVTVNGNSN